MNSLEITFFTFRRISKNLRISSWIIQNVTKNVQMGIIWFTRVWPALNSSFFWYNGTLSTTFKSFLKMKMTHSSCLDTTSTRIKLNPAVADNPFMTSSKKAFVSILFYFWHVNVQGRKSVWTVRTEGVVPKFSWQL